MFDFSDAIKSVEEVFTSLFNLLKTNKEEQCETQIIKDKKRLKKATNIAQEIFQITDEYKNSLPEEVLKEYNKLRKEFDKKD